MTAKTENKKPAKTPVGWRLPTGNLEKAQIEARRLGMSITEFINYLMVSYFVKSKN